MCERVEAMNPVYAMRIIDCDDLHPRGFSESELVNALNELGATRHDYDMLMESATFEEVDAYYNPGTDEISPDYILEAIVVDKFSKTERRMAAVVRVLNRHLAGKEITALDAIVGKPRKRGSFAYVTVQLPFSDGQVVSVIFHAPEGDRKKITPSDRIVAFQWLLNKRDITQVVAPEDGSEVSLESIGKRITQLVVKNSARFERTQKEAAAERKALDEAREAVKNAEDKQRELMDGVAQASKDAETVTAQLSNTLALLEKQKTINAELQAKLDAMRKARPQGGGKPAGTSGEGAGRNGAGVESGSVGAPDGATVSSYVKDGGVWKMRLKDGKLIDLPITTQESAEAQWRFIHERGNAEPSEPVVLDVPLSLPKTEYRPEEMRVAHVRDKGKDWYLVQTRRNDGEWVTQKEHTSAQTAMDDAQGWYPAPQEPEGGNTGANTATPVFATTLNDIVAGKYDGDTDKVDRLLDEAAGQAEAAGRFEEFEALFNRAADHLTELLKKKQGAM